MLQLNQLADGGGGQHKLDIVIYSAQKKKLAVSEGGGLSGGGLTEDYYINRELKCDVLVGLGC